MMTQKCDPYTKLFNTFSQGIGPSWCLEYCHR